MSYSKILILCYLLALTACSTTPQKPTAYIVPSGDTSDRVVNDAYHWLGTPYRYGGTTKSGMDCSGLVHTVFAKSEINLPRTAHEQATIGHRITRKEAKPGDLIFFRTSGRRISHVGIINEIKGRDLYFIHASESRGVIVSSTDNPYWQRRIVQLNRVINP